MVVSKHLLPDSSPDLAGSTFPLFKSHSMLSRRTILLSRKENLFWSRAIALFDNDSGLVLSTYLLAHGHFTLRRRTSLLSQKENLFCDRAIALRQNRNCSARGLKPLQQQKLLLRRIDGWYRRHHPYPSYRSRRNGMRGTLGRTEPGAADRERKRDFRRQPFRRCRQSLIPGLVLVD